MPGSETPAADGASLRDVPEFRQVLQREQRFSGHVLGLRTDRVDLGDGEVVRRDVVQHPGAVGVIALDERDRVLLVRQYRHPVASMLWEPPAGLLDVPGEDFLAAAQRELYEEAGYRADVWHVLIDLYTTPGGSEEALRLYLARGLRQVPAADRHEGSAEERDMPLAWVALDEAVAAVMDGRLHNPAAVAGLLAAWFSRQSGWSNLRPAEAPWDKHTSSAG